METSGFGRILVAVDASASARRAVDVAVAVAKAFSAELTILHIAEEPSSIYFSKEPIEIDLDAIGEIARSEAEKLVAEATSLSEARGVKAKQKVIRYMGSPVEGITEYADKNGIDLIVVGTRGLGGFKKLLLGSVASGVVSYANCAVLVVR